jgi:hypothetical protein
VRCNPRPHSVPFTLTLTMLCCAVQDSRGNPRVRADVAKFIEERDGVGPADTNVSNSHTSVEGLGRGGGRGWGGGGSVVRECALGEGGGA